MMDNSLLAVRGINHKYIVVGKEKAKNPPSWALGNKPYADENGKDFAKRLCDDYFGEGNYDTRGQSDYSKIRKWGDRGFE